MTGKHRSSRTLPDWLIGLILAIVLVAGVWLWLSLAGAGDDPSFDGTQATDPGAHAASWVVSAPGSTLI